jgi:MPBQ/MSBQ methyltransferase
MALHETVVKLEDVVKHYDTLANWSELSDFYRGTDFLNFGYFEPDTKDQKEACENLMEQLLAYIEDKSGNILDVACGKGATTAYLLRYYEPQDVVGINISDQQLDFARRNAPGVKFINMSATEMDFPDNSFDNIICVEAIFHFVTRLDFLASALRLLKPGGAIVFTDILMSWEGENRRERRTTENYVADLETYRTLLNSVGFASIEVEDITEQSWRRHYHYVVSYIHEMFLRGDIDREQLASGLHNTYERVPDLKYYLKVCCRK